MPFRFRRSLKVAPGIRLNLGKRSGSISIGPRGSKTTIGTRGVQQTTGIPGTGISYTKKVKALDPKKTHTTSGVVSTKKKKGCSRPALLLIILAFFAWTIKTKL